MVTQIAAKNATKLVGLRRPVLTACHDVNAVVDENGYKRGGGTRCDMNSMAGEIIVVPPASVALRLVCP